MSNQYIHYISLPHNANATERKIIANANRQLYLNGPAYNPTSYNNSSNNSNYYSAALYYNNGASVSNKDASVSMSDWYTASRRLSP